MEKVEQEILNNTFRFWLNAAQAGKMETQVQPDVSYIFNVRGDWPNRIFNCRFSEESAVKRINSIIDIYRVMQIPVAWVTTPFDKPDNLSEIIQMSCHAELMTLSGMFLPLVNISKENVLLPDYVIKEINGFAEITRWCEIVFRSFGVELNPCILLLLSQQNNVRLYLCECSGQPAASCMLFTDEKTAGLHFVGTLKEYNRKGIATAMTQYAALEAAKMGKHKLVLWASEQGKPVYQRIGFQDCFPCTFHFFKF